LGRWHFALEESDNVRAQSKPAASRDNFLGGVVIGAVVLGAVVLYAATSWLWLVVHQGLH
jgi:hypothetical protein